ncbi:MAG: CCA tRNA nucleotidyltransferase [Candidatus Doudnabacteria bacterium]|nr:CCA tRNA nucleotidyltransferase [Candidatus Doudnabacteria bacterium]
MQKLNWKPKSELEKAGLDIVRLLNNQKFQGFFVGGYVRDLITGKTSDNIDIATDALPDNVEKILTQAKISFKQIGKKYGTILATPKGNLVEITTFRRESRYSDLRHPDEVEFIREYLDDAQRRDLTINALYFNPVSRELFDPAGGMEDIKKRIIRFVGDPKKRIDEDPLRMMRAVRFAVTLGFRLEKNSFAAIKTRAKLIQDVSAERIKQELDKILLCSDRVRGLDELCTLGLMKFILPEFVQLKKVFHNSKKYHLEGSMYYHTLSVVGLLPPDLDLIYAGWFHDIGKIKPSHTEIIDGEKVMRHFGHQKVSHEIFLKFASRFRFSKRSRNLIDWLIIHHDDRLNFRTAKPLKQAKYALHPDFSALLVLWRADSAGNLRLMENGGIKPGNSESVQLGEKYLEVIRAKKSLLDKFAGGAYIMRVTKLSSGIQIGQIASAMKVKILLSEIKNENDAGKFLKKYAKST